MKNTPTPHPPLDRGTVFGERLIQLTREAVCPCGTKLNGRDLRQTSDGWALTCRGCHGDFIADGPLS